jgi:hypothetical protein
MNQEQIDKLRAAGYTDDDIRDFTSNQPKANNAPAQSGDQSLPEIDVTKPSDILSQAEAAGVPTGARPSSLMSDIATVAPVVLAENAGKLALGGLGAGALGAGAMYKSGKAKELEAEKIRQAGIQKRFDAKMDLQRNPAPVPAPVTQAVAPSPLLDAQGRPMQVQARPVVPEPSMASKVQAAAAQRITNMPSPGMLAGAGRMAGKLLPGVGTALNAADAYGRFQEGDYLGAGIAGVGAAASPFPVAGTVIGAGTGALNAYRDYLKREEEKKRMAQQ